MQTPVTVTTTCHFKGIPQDADNICDKLIIDGLVKCGVIPDDNWRFLRTAATTTHRLCDEHGERIEVVVRTTEA